MSAPRVRFAPAPTGFLHVGSARAALFNWLFARHTGGTFVLRIEDTDPARSRDDLVAGIERTLHWLGLDWDEGPFRQSTRMHLYAAAADRLLADGLAYWCDCPREAIDARTAAAGDRPGYDGYCRDRHVKRGPGTALRLHTPDSGETVVHDLIRGDVRFDHVTLEDFVVQRADGTPTFLLANAVDDADMAISHVVRGEDLLPSTPKVLLLRQALGNHEVPVFAHLPLLVDEKRRKLSKRRHAVAVEEYREQGYLPEAVRNYLALLGWAPPGDREIVPLDEMVDLFDLESVNKAPAFFDVTKLGHVNAEYVRALPVATFVRESLPWLMEDPPWPPERLDPGVFEAVAPLVQERVRTLGEVPAMVDFLFLEQPVIDDEAWAKAVTRQPLAGALLHDAASAYESCHWDAEALHQATSAVAEAQGLKLAKAQAPIRVAVTGRAVGPPLFESLQALGRGPTLERLRAAHRRWASEQPPSPPT
ncbi:MAG: glutamate--tRNA ligase [Acidimicrobiia bacterium]|nr:glutamate--tRNA ligase [Acidimicrobiia bacterium]